MSERAQQFVEVYRQARIEDQRSFYEQRATSFHTAHRQLLLTSSIIFGVSAALGLIAGLNAPGKLVWAVLAAILPAVTTVLAAYEGMYAFERIAKLYRDAARNLRRVETPSLTEEVDEDAAVAQYLAEVETIFANERGQWGQLAVDTVSETRQS